MMRMQPVVRPRRKGSRVEVGGPAMKRLQKTERGAVLVAVAVFMGALLALTAIGIDIGRLAHVATEVQTVADVAATAGALGLSDNNGAAGTGITRAQAIANQNFMNGMAAPSGNVVVDEGYFDNTTTPPTFLYCTQNTSCATNGYWGVPGSPVVTCSSATGAGHDCSKRDSVLALPNTTVHNLFAGIFDFFQNGRIAAAATGSGNANTAVEKVAVASYSGPATGCTVPAGCAPNDWSCFCQHGVAPCLPLAAPTCDFPSPCFEGTCQLPPLTVSPSGTANWTGFQQVASTNNIRAYLNQGPCQAPGSASSPGTQSIYGASNQINLTNGINGSGGSDPFALMQCLYRNNQGCAADANGNITGPGGTVFQIPIFDYSGCPSNNASGPEPLAGFATVQVTSVVISGNTKQVNLITINHSDTSESPNGGGCFGTNCRVVLAQ